MHFAYQMYRHPELHTKAELGYNMDYNTSNGSN